MVKQDTSVPYHVSLRDPLSIKLSDRRESVIALDATVEPLCPDAPAGSIALHATTMYRAAAGGQSPINMRITIYVPLTNVAAFVPQPFKER